MFHRDCWAKTFLALTGNNVDTAVMCLKAFSLPIKSAHSVFSGHCASAKMEKILRESISSAGAEGGDSASAMAMEYAVRFICLLIEKNYFAYIDLLINKIEQMLDEQKKILAVTVESASEPDSAFVEKLASMIKEKTGASGVKIETRVKPELLGGYLLRIGGFYVDASLKGQIKNMEADLKTAVEKVSLMAANGGDNVEL